MLLNLRVSTLLRALSRHALRLALPELGVGGIYFIAASGAVLLTRVAGGIALIWPANAIAAALFIRFARVRWFVAAAAVFAACVAANVGVSHRDWPISIFFACVNGTEIALTVWVFRSLMQFKYPHLNLHQAAIMAALFGIGIPGVLAIGGGIALHGNYGFMIAQGTLQWWSSHTIGACLVAPPIILWSSKSVRRLVSVKYRAENLLTLLVVLIGCWMAIRYIRFPFVAIGVLLTVAASRVGGFGTAVLGLCSGCMMAMLWSLGVRPEGLESTRLIASLVELPVIAVLATILPPIAVGLGTDARRATVRKLHVSERRFREAMEHSPIGMLIADVNGVWEYTNIALQKMLGYTAEEFRALPPGGPSDSEEWTTSAARWKRLMTGELSYYDVERRFRHKDGGWVWTRAAVSLVRDDDGLPLHLIAQIESLEARRHAEASLAGERERLKVTLTSIADAVITTDADTRITYINPAGEKLLGQQLRDLEQRRLDEVISLTEPHTSRAAANLVGQSRVHGTAFRRDGACVLHRPDGVACYVRDVVSPVLDAQGCVTGIVMVLQDASADFERARDLRHRASHDLLTGLANRFEFQRRLAEVFQRSQHAQVPAALLAIDLDRFKAVNDNGGHAAGDAMLRRVADVLKGSGAVRRSDTIARLGGDEFVILLENCPESRCAFVGHQILRALNPLRVDCEGATYEIGASMGLAMLTPDCVNEAAWLTAADRACYQAKREGRGRLRTIQAGAEAALPPLSESAGF